MKNIKGKNRLVGQETLARDLEVWGRNRSVSFDFYLQGIIASLKTNEDLGRWAQYSPSDWLPKPRSHRARKMADIGRIIAITRNVLIFTPVALTWFAIGKATRAFDEFVSTGTGTTANFLEFWQDGKGLLAPEWRIGNVATLAFQLIIVLILLSFSSGLLQARAIRVSSRDNTRFEQERISFAVRIDEALAPYKTISNSEISQAVLRLMDKLDLSANVLLDISESLQKSSGSYSKTISLTQKEINSSLKKVERISQEFKSAATTARKNLDQLSKESKKKRKRV